MRVSILKETKENEARVAMVPDQVRTLVAKGAEVWVQHNAGSLVGYENADYQAAGARIVDDLATCLQADLVCKVKEPTLEEVDGMHPGQMLFCYLHLAAIPQTLQKILDKKIVALAYETLEMPDRSLPLLAPMSEIAGKLATQSGSHFLRFDQGGRGVLLGGTEKVPPAEVLVIGAGVVGMNAAKVSVGMGAKTRVVDVSQPRLDALRHRLGALCETYISTAEAIESLTVESDLVVGAVLITGARAPKLITENLVRRMRRGSVIVDVAVDQGGCVETSEVTSHTKPVVRKHDVLHYGVPNMPAAVPVTSTLALTKETYPYIERLAELGFDKATTEFPELKKALNCFKGEIAHEGLKGIL